MAEKEQEENCPAINNDIKDLLVTSCIKNDERKLRIVSVKEMQLISEEIILESTSTFTSEYYIENVVRLMNNNEFTDVTVCVEGQKFECHLAILQCYSDYFMAFNGSQVINIPEGILTPETFRLLYTWMKHNDAKPQREGIVELYLAAKYLQMDELISQLWFCFDDTSLFTEDQAFMLYMEAAKYDVKMLKELMFSRISKFFICVVATKEFLEFTEKEVISLLSSNYIAVNSEMEVLMSLFRWLSYNWDERSLVAEKMLKYVRFSLMPGWFLTTLESMKEPSIVVEVLQIPEVVKSIEAGISYAVSHQFMGVQLAELDAITFDYPVPRQWIINEKCNYHHKYDCKKWELITYEAFNNYLSYIIQTHGEDWKDFKHKCSEPTLDCLCDAFD